MCRFLKKAKISSDAACRWMKTWELVQLKLKITLYLKWNSKTLIHPHPVMQFCPWRIKQHNRRRQCRLNRLSCNKLSNSSSSSNREMLNFFINKCLHLFRQISIIKLLMLRNNQLLYKINNNNNNWLAIMKKIFNLIIMEIKISKF